MTAGSIPTRVRSGSAGSPSPRILVRGVNWLGDAVMTTPALRRLRERWPQAHIGLLTPAKLADLWVHHPAVDEVIAFTSGETPWGIGRRLRAGGFEVGILFTDSPRSALELWFGRVARRIGFAGRWRRRLLTEVVERRPAWVPMRKRSPREVRALLAGRGPVQVTPMPSGAHQMHHYLQLAARLGADPQPLPPEVRLSAAELAAARVKVSELAGVGATGNTPSRWLGLNAGAEYGPAKRWPVERFAAVANDVSRRTGAGWLVLGGANDQALAAVIQAAVPTARSLAGRTTLRELMAVLTVCELLLTNDTGPTHLAAALGTPVVVVFGSTSPELTAPGLPGDPRHAILRQPVPCAPCFLRECPADFRCMNRVTVEEVTQAVLSRLLPGGRPL